MIHALPITQHLAVITLFLSIFHALLVGRFGAGTVGWAVVLMSATGQAIRRIGWREGAPKAKESSEWICPLVLVLKLKACLAIGLLPPTTSIRPLLLPPLLLSLLSPVLGTLTSATTSDSIWPLAGFLFFVHLLLADFTTGPDARQKYREKLRREQRRRRRNSLHGDLEAVEEKSCVLSTLAIVQTDTICSLSSSLSFTSALSASVVLASRLPSTAHVFSLVLLAVSLFAGWPTVAKGVRETGKGFSVVLTASMVILSLSFLPGEATEPSSVIPAAPTLIFVGVLLVVNVIGPFIFWYGWRWKTIRGGGWDVAVVRIRQAANRPS